MSNPTAPLRIALVAWRGLPAALSSAGKRVGGLETGAWELAQGLAALEGCQVTFVTEHSRAVVPGKIAGVNVQVEVNRWKELREDFSNNVELTPKLRIKRWHWRLLYQFPVLLATRPWRAADPPAMAAEPRLLHIDCDVWGCFGVNQDSARVIAAARAQQRPCILFLESNADLSDSVAAGSDSPNPYGVTSAEQEFCLTHASVVVCQSHWQLKRYRAQFDHPSELIRNPIRLEQWSPSQLSVPQHSVSQLSQPQHSDDGYVLWIGRYDDFHKRPLLALQIARLCPDIPFKLVVNRSSSASSAEIEDRVRQSLPHNCTIVDYIPYSDMPQVFHAARTFLSTSSASHEGFPNVILQAAASGTPIVSLEDFDEFIHGSGAGSCSHGDIAEAAKQLQLAWQRRTPPNAERVSESLRAFEWEFVARQVFELAAGMGDGE